jgi:hypothetical protein
MVTPAAPARALRPAAATRTAARPLAVPARQLSRTLGLDCSLETVRQDPRIPPTRIPYTTGRSVPVPSRSPGEIVEAWIEDLERNPTGAEAQNVVKKLPTLVRVERSVTFQAPYRRRRGTHWRERRSVAPGIRVHGTEERHQEPLSVPLSCSHLETSPGSRGAESSSGICAWHLS